VTVSLAISPCPNDTFVFHALVHGLVPGAPPVDVTYADVDVTNLAASKTRFDLVKVSCAALPWLLDKYALLPCGGAVGRGCGPIVVVRDPEATPSLAGRTVAVPGDRTTAYVLMRLWAVGAEPARVKIVPFHEIMPAVAAGEYDAGLVIHEARFTYPRHGLHALVDLGQWWEQDTGLPVPLGAILARRGAVDAAEATEWVRASVRQAWDDPEATQEYVLSHAQELEPAVVSRHIALFVNEFTADLGADGYAAIDALLSRAAAAGLTPPVPEPLP
jgi:1,4-dihydroxy-6-naphthoate synthase